MLEILLKWAALLLGLVIVAGMAALLIRWGLKELRLWYFEKRRRNCENLLRNLLQSPIDQRLFLLHKIKKEYPENILEEVLDGIFEQADPDAQKNLANLYDQSGFYARYIHQLREAKSWVERAESAEKLGRLRHPGAVLSLIAVIQDPTEELEVKNVAMKALGKIQDPRAVAPLIEALGSSDPGTGRILSNVLIQFEKEAVPPLLEALESSPEEGRRLWAVRILEEMSIFEAVPLIIGALKDHSEKVREAAAMALGQFKDARAVHPLCEVLLNDPVPLVRERAAEALGSLADERAMETLKRSLSDLEYKPRLAAMEALEKMGEKAFPLFLEALEDPNPQTRSQAAAALERMGRVHRAIENLSKPEDKEAAFDLLLKIAKAGVVETITRSLSHPDFNVRAFLCEILKEARNHRALEALLEVLEKDKEWLVRLRAVEALIALGEARVLPVIVRTLKEEPPSRESVLKAMLSLAQHVLASVAPELVPYAHDGNPRVRLAAVRLFGTIRSPSVIEALAASLKDPSAEVRVEAAAALGARHQEGKGSAAVPALMAAIKDPETQVRAAAVKSLIAYRDARAIPALARAFELADESYRDDISAAIAGVEHHEFFKLADFFMGSVHPKARAGFAWTLGLIADKQGLKFLSQLLKDKEPLVRAAAAGGLGLFGNGEIVSILEEYLKDPNERVRAAVVNAMGKSGNAEAAPRLFPLLQDPDSFVCQRALLAIGALAGSLDIERKEEARNALRQFGRRTLEPPSQMAVLIGLILLRDEARFEECLKAVQDPESLQSLRRLLKSVPSAHQNLFLDFLSLDPQLFWAEASSAEKTAAHYSAVLGSSREPEKRLRAIQALVLLQAFSSLPLLESAFKKDPDPRVRVQAFLALSGMLKGRALAEKIALALQDPNPEVRAHVLGMLKKLSPKQLKDSRELFLPLLDISQEDIRLAVSDLLARLYEEDWRELAQALEKAESRLRKTGLILALGKIGNPQSAEVFLKLLQEKDLEVRTMSLRIAAEMGLLSKEELLPYLEDPQEAVRVAAVRGLERQLDAEVFELLFSRLEDPSALVRRELAAALGRQKRALKDRSIDILTQMTKDPDLEVKLQSFVSLYRLGVSGLARQAGEIAQGLDAESRRRFTARLEQDGIISEVISALRKDRSAAKRVEALEFLAALDLRSFAREIASSLGDPSEDVRIAAVKALAPLKDPEMMEAIRVLERDPAERVRLAVKWSRLNL